MHERIIRGKITIIGMTKGGDAVPQSGSSQIPLDPMASKMADRIPRQLDSSIRLIFQGICNQFKNIQTEKEAPSLCGESHDNSWDVVSFVLIFDPTRQGTWLRDL